jgi:hypothetical protein
MLGNAIKWVRKRFFCFPCETRTIRMQDALESSKRALGIRMDAVNQLKEYTDEQRHQRAFN